MSGRKSTLGSRWERWVPGVRLIREYELSWLTKGLAAGITLGVLMFPVGLAFGEMAGVPLGGLYAGMLPLIAYALFGSSRQLIIGPDVTVANC
ncbi:MAG TPA: SulP family inorganic anion transporter [Candidatus Binataceae bacterium]|nr:SulP family inorganic anion transporter [Candidatus Binataceae bacterium]